MLNSQSNHIPPFHAPEFDWLGLCMAWSEPLCSLPIHIARTACQHKVFQANTQNEQLDYHKEQFAEFNKLASQDGSGVKKMRADMQRL